MKKAKISNKDLRHLDFSHPEDLKAISTEANKLLKRKLISKPDLLATMAVMLDNPEAAHWQNHPLQELNHLVASSISKQISNPSISSESEKMSLRSQSLPYPIYGKDHIETGALAQMDRAMSLPISIAGALMPDAHEGYGLPIGGVLATDENMVIPYAVGVDIACRMCMSIYPVSSNQVDLKKDKLMDLLGLHTIFGVGSKNKNHFNTEVFDRPEWNATEFIRKNRDLAFSQLGTSGAGNHFVEWGELTVLADVPEINLIKGKYLALLSHSGSRGFGNEVASYYSKVAMSKVSLPKEARHLVWLNLSSQEGNKYWIAMNLAGEYASANHREIHQKIARGFGLQSSSTIENHHNFAWKEQLPNGQTAIVHRKGATPAPRSDQGSAIFTKLQFTKLLL